jgi:CheY-like chemotaxis protein/HPt (histidine-containing phosphotransfer) domain-containing protein
MLDIVTRRDLPTVLLIDDDLVSREVMATVLTMSGYTVHTAADGTSALDLLAGEECVPGVILMDAQMPGLSGTQLIEQLRAHTKARLYAISASNAPDQVIAAADGFLLKPFAPEALTKLLEDHLAQSQPPAASGLDPDETIVNPATLAQLREMMPEAAVRQIFEAIVADLARRIPALVAAIAKNDLAEVCRIGHAIKGGCSMAGALQAARIGALIEGGGIEVTGTGVNQVDNSAAVLRDLRAAAANLRRMLDAEFQA